MHCIRELVVGSRYVVGEIAPSGFGLWGRNRPNWPIRVYANHLDVWNAAVDDFNATGGHMLSGKASRSRTA